MTSFEAHKKWHPLVVSKYLLSEYEQGKGKAMAIHGGSVRRSAPWL